MTLKALFQKRQTRYIKDILKYARIIFNDHFVLLLFLLFGAGGYAYSQYLDALTQGAVQPRLLLLLLYFLVTTTGSITLLLEPADQIFLLPKEQTFKQVFKQLVVRSYVGTLFSVGIVTVVTFPILVATVGNQTIDLLVVFLALAGLKWFSILLKVFPYFEKGEEVQQRYRLAIRLFQFAAIFGLLFIHLKWVALFVIGVALFTAIQFFTEKIFFNRLFHWNTMIEAEENRMQKLYRFIGMFTNVPNIQTKIKRLAWLDPLLANLSKRHPDASYYYVLRLIARNTEYSLLIIRATLVGALILAVTETVFISAVLVVLFLYIIGFQLLTLVNELNRVPLFQIYPITAQEKNQAVYRLIFQILFVASILLAAAALNGIGPIGLSLVILGGFFAHVFSYIYAPRRLKANN